MSEQGYIVVVGGVNVDIRGQSAAPLVAGDSNPGTVTVSMGGVGRNIAHNLALLGENVKMLTALGDDFYAREVENACRRIPIDISHALRVTDAATSTYLFISNPEGEMVLAINDMALCERITKTYLQENQFLLDGALAVVADANLPETSLQYLAEHCHRPLFVDPVSTVKAKKLKNILHGIYALKPNRMEAELLSGVAITDEASLQKAAQVLLNAGVKRVYISLGSRGVFAAEEGRSALLPCCEAQVKNTTGAGDAFMAGLVQSYGKDYDLMTSAQYASAVAAIATEGEETINPHLCASLAARRAYRK